jgi:O-acetyl-ADP-ribose deacetylase (regulator of RNase III)
MTKVSQNYILGSSRVIVRIGNILDSEVDVIVSSDDHRFTMGGGVSLAIRAAGGEKIREDAQRQVQQLKQELELGDVAVTTAGTLPFRNVFHAVSRFAGRPPSMGFDTTRNVIEKAVTKSLKLLEGIGAKSIAFPAIGTGFAERPPADVAAVFAQTLGPLLLSSPSALKIEIVIHDTAFPQDIGFMDFFRNFDNQTEWIEKVVRDHTIVMVHGIRTDGRWNDMVGRLLREADHTANPVPIGYGFLDLLSFLLPVCMIRNRLIRRVATELSRLSKVEGTKKFSVIAHSFGTFLTVHALQRSRHVELDCLILCGSVVPKDFPWDSIERQLRVIDPYEYPGRRVLNDCGWRDVWPVFAETITWGFGSSGRFGFQIGVVKDRFHELAHSEFFTDYFVKTYWVSAITEGRIIEGKGFRPQSKWLLQLLTRFHVKWVIVAVLIYGAYKTGVSVLFQ